MDAYTLNNTALALKEPPLSAGGEGAVYEIIGYPNRVAKIYHDASDAKQREAKIREMVTISGSYLFKSERIAQDIAWPLSPLFDKQHNFIGFGMSRIHAKKELDDLYMYPPKSNSSVTIKDRVTCLISLCDVIERLHRTGQIFGDFNPNNITIKPDWSVNFVDADSYHVKSKGKEYRCIVCAPGYVAPEVIRACAGTTYADCPGTTFTEETDNFALAIHVFRMLMNGCHPYACKRQPQRAGSAPAPKPLDRRVESGETPFFKTVPNCAAPPYAPDINSLPPYIRDLFRKAFVDGHSNPGARPSAAQWKSALIRYSGELVPCGQDHAHYYWKGNGSCPYCDADRRYAQTIKSFTGNLSTPKPAAPKPVAPKPVAPKPVARGNGAATGASFPARQVAAAAASGGAKTAATRWFWAITIALAVIMQIPLGAYVFPRAYTLAFGNETLVAIGVVGSVVAGVVGAVLYNRMWAQGRTGGVYVWWDYLLSELTALGFSVGFGIAMAAVVCAVYVLGYLLMAGFIVAVIAGMISGG